MPRKRGTLFLEVHNETRLVLFMFARLVRSKQKSIIAELFVFNLPPDTSTFNNENLQKIFPGKNYTWNITGAHKWKLRNRTRYNPLARKTEMRTTDGGRKTFIFRILASNNHISMEDIALLEKMGETIGIK